VAALVVGTVTACGAPERAAPVVVRSAPVLPTPTISAAPVPAGPSVTEIAAALGAIRTLRHPRDNTGSCAVVVWCRGLITAGEVSIYEWPDVTAASRYVGEGSGNADRIGRWVLSYRTREQRSTPVTVRRAFAQRVRAMVADGLTCRIGRSSTVVRHRRPPAHPRVRQTRGVTRRGSMAGDVLVEVEEVARS
jgi:hypothetical protein